MSALADNWAARYRSMLSRYGETIQVRRFSGVGAERTYTDYPALARSDGGDAKPLAGQINEHDRKIIVLAQDLVDAGLAFPVTNDDAVVIRGREIAITGVDDHTVVVAGTLVALRLTLRD